MTRSFQRVSWTNLHIHLIMFMAKCVTWSGTPFESGFLKIKNNTYAIVVFDNKLKYTKNLPIHKGKQL